jgi:hypothetical protein
MGAQLSSPDIYRTQLQRVLESESFRNAESLRRLLSYLVERSLSHTADELKEYTIGLEVFGKPASYDPQKDAAVRVQIGRLRQKLEDYYKGEGSHDPYRLVVPKGHFTILFQPPDAATTAVTAAPVRRASAAQVGLIVALVLLAGFVVWTSLLRRKVETLESRLAPAAAASEFGAIWSGFLDPKTPSRIIFGSPPFFASASRRLFVRMYRPVDPDDPRSSEGFREVEEKVGPLQGPRYDYASMGDAMAVQRLTAFLSGRGVPLRALPAHLAVWDAVQDSNLIFLGAARMNPLLRRLPIQQDFELETDDYIHNRKPQQGEQAVYETPSHRDKMSYAVVGTYAGLKPGREIIVLTGHSTPATVGMVDFITSAEGVRLLRQKLNVATGDRKHFQILLRVFTDNDAPVKTEYVTHHVSP